MSLADQIDALLPQTQCARCGYPDCRSYAEAVAGGGAAINRCPPGGSLTIERLAAVTGRKPLPLDPECGGEGPPLVARIDESRCIGCTICIQFCPVDAIVGATKRMHTVMAQECTGCELCVTPCPVDCIFIEAADPSLADRDHWLAQRAPVARARYQFRQMRLEKQRGRRRQRRRLPSLAARRLEIAEAQSRFAQRRKRVGPPATD